MNSRIDYTQVSPAAVKGFGIVHGYLSNSGLEAALLELVYLRVSQLNGCAYCLDLHTRSLVSLGFTPQKLALVQTWREAGDLFTERERAGLGWAETVTRASETRVPDDEFQRASGVFSEKELSDLTMAVALMNAYNRIAISLRRPPAATRPAAA